MPCQQRTKARDRLTGAPPEWEIRLSKLFQEYQDRSLYQLNVAPKHLIAVAAALFRLPVLAALFRLPVLSLDLEWSGEGPAIRQRLRRTSRLGRLFLLRSVMDVLPVPADSSEYVLGASRQTLRRKLRAAAKAGITWRLEDCADARSRLLRSLAESERSHPLDRYRSQNPELADLTDYGMWVVAESRDGDPIFLAVIPVSGDWALLRYFRTIGHGEEQSLARYLMSKVVVDELAQRGVCYLVNADPPWELPSGLRHLQRMLGWRLARFRTLVSRQPSSDTVAMFNTSSRAARR